MTPKRRKKAQPAKEQQGQNGDSCSARSRKEKPSAAFEALRRSKRAKPKNDYGTSGERLTPAMQLLLRARTCIILGVFDEARDSLKKLLGSSLNQADGAVVQALLQGVDIHTDISKGVLSVRELRAALQVIYNRLCDPSVSSKAGRGIFPSWVLNSEILSLEFNLTSSGYEYHSDFKETSVSCVNGLMEVFDQSHRTDHVTLFRRIAVLIELSEIAHAKQALREAVALNPDYAPTHMLLGQIATIERRFDESLEHLYEARSKAMTLGPSPRIDFMISDCHFHQGNLEIAIDLAKQGMETWPDQLGFRNNYAYARTRELLATRGTAFWKDPEAATAIIDDFLSSIISIGSNGVAHFNYSLLLYWASQEGLLTVARKAVARHGRADLVASREIVSKAFQRAKRALLEERDYFQATLASYYSVRADGRSKGDVRSKILDELVWDSSNVISNRYDAGVLNRSFLTKDPRIRGVMDWPHLATLKRWMRAVPQTSIPDVQQGGGYYINWNEKGIVVNPETGFIRSYFSAGYSIREIDAIIVTSPYLVAYEELVNLLALITEAADYRARSSRVHVVLERRVFQRFPELHVLTGSAFATPQVLTPEFPNVICEGNMEILLSETTPRGDISSRCSVARMNLRKEEKVVSSIGFVYDFRDQESLPSILDGIDIIVVSIGDVLPSNLLGSDISETLRVDLMHLFRDDPLYQESFAFGSENIMTAESNGRHSNAPVSDSSRSEAFAGIGGLLQLADLAGERDTVIIAGDLPLALGDKRHKIAAVLNAVNVNGPRVLTEDVGLVIGLPEIRVLCEFEHKMVPVCDIDEEAAVGRFSGAVRHFCRSHRVDPRFAEFLKREI